MESTFLQAAHHRKNSWQRYLLGAFLAIVAPALIVALAIALVLGILAVVSPSIPREFFSNLETYLFMRFYGYPLLYFLIATAYLALATVTLARVVRRIHDRNPLTLLGLETGEIHWRRLFQGFIVSFGLFAIAFSIFYTVYPGRYKLSFNLGEWLLGFPLSFSLYGLLALIKCLFFFSYLLQAAGLLIQNPRRLTFVYGTILTGLTYYFFRPPLINLCLSAFILFFLTWITLKDDRLELAIGFLLARAIFFSTVTGSAQEALQLPTIFKQVEAAGDSLLSLTILLAQGAVFYVICFYVMPEKALRHSK